MRAHVWLLALLSVTATACVVVRRNAVEIRPDELRIVDVPLRVFMADGSFVVFPGGAVVVDDVIRGEGARYDLFREPAGQVATLPLDSVLGVEALTEPANVPLSLLATIGGAVLTVAGGIALACAADPKCFGSCPTIYSTVDGEAVLEAETFSYSVSPLLESRDLDGLAARSDANGFVELEIRNEALETHYINHLELVEIEHAVDERVLPDGDRTPAVIGPVRAFDDARDRSGRDVTQTLRAADDAVFATVPERIADVSAQDTRDWIDMTVPAVDADTVAVVVRLRNSLLNTVLFYELMLRDQGVGALEWMARDIARIGNAVELGAWYHRTMGLRLEVESDRGFEEVARLGDMGPIAWSEVALRLPVTRGRPTRLRLSFLADAWRIDRIAWSPRIRRAEGRTIPVAELIPITGEPAGAMQSQIAAADDDYLVTTAGSGFVARFDAGAEPAGSRRSFLLGSQGYYTEWVRPYWIRTGGTAGPFRPTPETVPELMRRWIDLKPAMESAFHATRIPVR